MPFIVTGDYGTIEALIYELFRALSSVSLGRSAGSDSPSPLAEAPDQASIPVHLLP